MEKVNRKRNRAITLRMTEDELAMFRNKVDASGLTQQEYFTRMVNSSHIPSGDSLCELKRINDTISDLEARFAEWQRM